MNYTHKAVNKNNDKDVVLVEEKKGEYLISWMVQLVKKDWIITPLKK